MLEKITHVYPCTLLTTVLSSVPLIAGYFGFLDLPSVLGTSVITAFFGAYFRMSERKDYELIGSLVDQEGLASILTDSSLKQFHNAARVWENEHPHLLSPKPVQSSVSSQSLRRAG